MRPYRQIRGRGIDGQHVAAGPDARRGSILILVVGVVALLAITATGVLLRVQAEGRSNRVIIQDAQCRLALTAAMHFLLESSRIGWHDSEEAYGWVDIRDGEPGPRTISNDTLAGSDWPALGSHYRGDMYAWQRPPYAMDPDPVPAAVPWWGGALIIGDNLSRPLPRNGGSFDLKDGYEDFSGNGTWKLDQNDAGATDGRITAVRVMTTHTWTPGRTGSVTISIFKDSGFTESIGSTSFTPSSLVIGEELEIPVSMEFTETNRFYAELHADDTSTHKYTLEIDYELDVEAFDADLNLFAGVPGEDTEPTQNPILNRELMKDFLERTEDVAGRWTSDSRDRMEAIWSENLGIPHEEVATHPAPAVEDWTAFAEGNKVPRGETLGRGWFRIYRETAAESEADGFRAGSTFVITVGAGGTRGFKDWAEADASGLFPSESVFNSLRRSERLQWYRVRWVPQTGGALESAWRQFPGELHPLGDKSPEHKVREDIVAIWDTLGNTTNLDSSYNSIEGFLSDAYLHRDSVLWNRFLTSLLTNIDPSRQRTAPFLKPQQGGSIDWVYRIEEEPDEW